MICTRCNGTGFLNVDQIPKEYFDNEALKEDEVLEWLADTARIIRDGCCSCHICPPCNHCLALHDVSVCDCCGDGEGWYGVRGEHYSDFDPKGAKGPYSSNGGLARCH